MIKGFPIEFIRQALEQKMFQEHVKNPKYIGGKDQVNIFSFYEQLKNQDEVDRYTERYKDLLDQQNRTDLIANGIISCPDNPTYTNLYSSMIIPMTWGCSLTSKLKKRDDVLETINHLTDELKGSKVDIAQLECVGDDNNRIYKPFCVGTIGHNDNAPIIRNGDYIGDITNPLTEIEPLIASYSALGVGLDTLPLYVYAKKSDGTLKVVKVSYGKESNVVDGVYEDNVVSEGRYFYKSVQLDGVYEEYQLYQFASASISLYGEETVALTITNGELFTITTVEIEGETYTKITLRFDLGDSADNICPGWYGTYDIEDEEVFNSIIGAEWLENDGTIDEILFPPEHTSFEKYKLSISFDSIRCNEPYILNAEELCTIMFGGSATLVNDGVALGNDLIKVAIKRDNIVAETPITYNDAYTYLEPMEMPSGNNPSVQPLQILSNKMLSNTQTDSFAVSIQYSFIADMKIELIKNWFKYARYGSADTTKISPNIIYKIKEIWSSWSEVEVEEYLGKIADTIEIDNTESDTLTLGITMQVQGANN